VRAGATDAAALAMVAEATTAPVAMLADVDMRVVQPAAFMAQRPRTVAADSMAGAVVSTVAVAIVEAADTGDGED
jgi:hypothetical protein